MITLDNPPILVSSRTQKVHPLHWSARLSLNLVMAPRGSVSRRTSESVVLWSYSESVRWEHQVTITQWDGASLRLCWVPGKLQVKHWNFEEVDLAGGTGCEERAGRA